MNKLIALAEDDGRILYSSTEGAEVIGSTLSEIFQKNIFSYLDLQYLQGVNVSQCVEVACRTKTR